MEIIIEFRVKLKPEEFNWTERHVIAEEIKDLIYDAKDMGPVEDVTYEIKSKHP